VDEAVERIASVGLRLLLKCGRRFATKANLSVWRRESKDVYDVNHSTQGKPKIKVRVRSFIIKERLKILPGTAAVHLVS
jgi:hypothetical protein